MTWVVLKDACEESLVEDLNTKNVIERLNEASLCQLDKKKKGCFTYLIDFGKIHDMRDEISNFGDNSGVAYKVETLTVNRLNGREDLEVDLATDVHAFLY